MIHPEITIILTIGKVIIVIRCQGIQLMFSEYVLKNFPLFLTINVFFRNENEENISQRSENENERLGDAYAPPEYAVPAPAPAHVYAPAPAYASPPPVSCPQNLMISCTPSVQSVPCSSQNYAPQPYIKPAYRVANDDIEEKEDSRDEPKVGQSQDA